MAAPAGKPLPQVLVTIINMNGSPFVMRCVSSVVRTDYHNFSVVVFDCGSTDGSFEALKEICRQEDNVLLLRSSRNIPLARATNLVFTIAGAQPEYFAHLDNDVIVQPDWLLKLTEVLESDCKIGSCQPLLVLADSRDTIDGTGDFMDVLGNTISRYSALKLASIDVHNIDQAIFSARGAAVIIRRTLFERLRGMDESFGIIYEDVDLGWRIRLAGYSNRLVAKSIVFHKAGSTTGTLSKTVITYEGTKNRINMLLKNYDIGTAIKYLPLRITLDFLKCAFFVVSGRLDLALAVIRAFSWNLSNLRAILLRRVETQTNVRKVSDSELIGGLILRRLLVHPIQSRRKLRRSEDLKV